MVISTLLGYCLPQQIKRGWWGHPLFFFAFAKQPVAQGFKLQKNSFTLLFLFDTCALYPLQISFVFSTLAI